MAEPGELTGNGGGIAVVDASDGTMLANVIRDNRGPSVRACSTACAYLPDCRPFARE